MSKYFLLFFGMILTSPCLLSLKQVSQNLSAFFFITSASDNSNHSSSTEPMNEEEQVGQAKSMEIKLIDDEETKIFEMTSEEEGEEKGKEEKEEAQPEEERLTKGEALVSPSCFLLSIAWGYFVVPKPTGIEEFGRSFCNMTEDNDEL